MQSHKRQESDLAGLFKMFLAGNIDPSFMNTFSPSYCHTSLHTFLFVIGKKLILNSGALAREARLQSTMGK